MLRDLDRTPVFSRDGVVLNQTARRNVSSLAEKIGAVAATVEQRWLETLDAVLDDPVDNPSLRALAELNPGASAELLAAGRLEDFSENVEYHGRRLAKLDFAPASTLASVSSYQQLLLEELTKRFPEQWTSQAAALDQLYFSIKLTLNNAYYDVRDAEATAFFEVLSDQLESLSVKELLERALETLVRTFRADAGLISFKASDAPGLALRAWTGLDQHLAQRFHAELGADFAADVADAGSPDTILDVSADPRLQTAEIREQFRSIWGVPLVVRERITGVVQLVFSQEYLCLPREMKLLEALADRCALAIDKAQLLEELHEREERIRKLSEHMMRVEEEERRRISRELHDEVGQSLLVVRLNLEMIQRNAPADTAVGEKLEATREVVEDTIVEMRRLISKLSPNVLQELGLPASIRQFVKNLNRTFKGRIRLRMSDVDELPERTKIMLYRLVQECFANAVKHSGAANVCLQLTRRNGEVRLRMEDDGMGFDLEEALRKRESFGLAGMQERVELLGGKIDIETAPGKGAAVSIAIPC